MPRTYGQVPLPRSPRHLCQLSSNSFRIILERRFSAELFHIAFAVDHEKQHIARWLKARAPVDLVPLIIITPAVLQNPF